VHREGRQPEECAYAASDYVPRLACVGPGPRVRRRQAGAEQITRLRLRGAGVPARGGPGSSIWRCWAVVIVVLDLANPAIGMNALFTGQAAHNLDRAYRLGFDEAEISVISVVDPPVPAAAGHHVAGGRASRVGAPGYDRDDRDSRDRPRVLASSPTAAGSYRPHRTRARPGRPTERASRLAHRTGIHGGGGGTTVALGHWRNHRASCQCPCHGARRRPMSQHAQVNEG